MGSGEVRITFGDRRTALEAYTAGLQHGLLTTPADVSREIGQRVDVHLDLAFADASLFATGWVVHTSHVATVIRLEKVPPDLHRIVAGGRVGVRQPGWSTADPYPTTADGEDDAGGRHTITQDGEEAGPGSGTTARPWGSGTSKQRSIRREDERPRRTKRANYLANRLRQSLGDRTSSDGFEAVSGPQPVAPARPPKVAGPEPASPQETMSRGPGIPVPGEPNRYLPGIARFEGPLEDTPPSKVLLDLYASRSTGVLVVELEDARYWGFFLGGQPVHYLRHPPLESESTESLMIRKQLLSKPVLDRARWHAEVTGQPLVSIVMRMRLISEKQLHDLRAAQIKLVTRRLLDQSTGFYRFFETADLREVFRNPPINPVPLIWNRAIFSLSNRSEAQIQARLEPHLGRGIHVTELGRKIAPKLPIDELCRDLVRALVKGGATLRTAMERSDLGKRDAAELLLVMEQLGLLRFVRIQRRIDPEAARAQRALQTLVGRLYKDHFTFLDLHWSALPEELLAGCERLDRQVRELSEQCSELAERAGLVSPLAARLETVVELAGDAAARKAYRASVVGESERFMAAEMYLKQGEMALFRRDAAQARDCFSRLLEVEPQGPGSQECRDRAGLVLLALDEGEIPRAAR